METQRPANTHLLACCGPPCHPGHGHLAPNGGSFPRPGSLAVASRVFAPVLPRAPWFLSAPLALSVLALLRICHGRPWRLATLAPQGLGPGVPCLTAPAAIFVSAVSPSFVGALCRACCGSMSRGEDLRRLAAQLTVLAELEDFVAVGISRMAAPAPPPACAQPPLPPQRPRLRPPRPSGSCPAMRLQRPRRAQLSPRLPPPGPAPGLALPCRSRSVLRGAAPAPSLSRVAPSPSLSGDWSRAWPSRAAHQSLPRAPAAASGTPRPSGEASEALHQPKALRLPALLTSRPTLTANGMPSSTHTASLRLPLSLQPPSPSRPTPLELVGVLAIAQNRQALHVARDLNALSGSRTPRRLRSWRCWLWLWSWMRAHF